MIIDIGGLGLGFRVGFRVMMVVFIGIGGGFRV